MILKKTSSFNWKKILGLTFLTSTLVVAGLFANDKSRAFLLNSSADGGNEMKCVYDNCSNFKAEQTKCNNLYAEDDKLWNELHSLRNQKQTSKVKARIIVLEEKMSIPSENPSKEYLAKVKCSYFYDKNLIGCMDRCAELYGKTPKSEKDKNDNGRSDNNKNRLIKNNLPQSY